MVMDWRLIFPGLWLASWQAGKFITFVRYSPGTQTLSPPYTLPLLSPADLLSPFQQSECIAHFPLYPSYLLLSIYSEDPGRGILTQGRGREGRRDGGREREGGKRSPP